MQEIFLVTIDATNLPRTINYQDRDGGRNARSATLPASFQNFYFIHANDGETAKRMVINTFRAKPRVAEDVSRCIVATPLKQITKLLNERNNTWSYIPIGGVRAAGQQGNNDTLRTLQKMQQNASSENPISHMNWQPPRPVTYDAQVVSEKDLRSVPLDDVARRASTPAAPISFDPNAQMTPAQMQQMMQLMMAQMSAQQNQNVDLTKHRPENDPELAARIRANMTSGPVPDDAGLTSEERAEIARLDESAKSQMRANAVNSGAVDPNLIDIPVEDPIIGYNDDMTTIDDDDLKGLDA